MTVNIHNVLLLRNGSSACSIFAECALNHHGTGKDADGQGRAA